MNVRAMRAVVVKDLRVLRHSRPVMAPLIALPLLVFIGLPLLLGLIAPFLEAGGSGALPEVRSALMQASPAMRDQLASATPPQLVVILMGLYLLAPLFLIVPITVASVIAADSFAGEKERRTFEALAYSPITDRELFLAKVAGAWLPAVAVTVIGFVLYGLTLNTAAWPVMGRVFFPNVTWLVLVLWVAPGVSALALGVTVYVSARVRTVQEAFQLSGIVVLPLMLLLLGQMASMVYLSAALAALLGALVWAVALAVLGFGARGFRRWEALARS